MSRPEFPRCIMPTNVIQSIRREQNYYDEDPERYERIEKEREEERQQERLREQEYYDSESK